MTSCKVWEIPVVGVLERQNLNDNKIGTLYVGKTSDGNNGWSISSSNSSPWQNLNKSILSETLNKDGTSIQNLFSDAIRRHIVTHFFPVDFPKSVGVGYKEFIFNS